MTGSKSKLAARKAAELARRFPNESKEQLTRRLCDLLRKDEMLMQSAAEEALSGILDEMYDEAAREGREIPEALSKPS